eukprot:4504854-Pyramimonas_sp.AAC.1
MSWELVEHPCDIHGWDASAAISHSARARARLHEEDAEEKKERGGEGERGERGGVGGEGGKGRQRGRRRRRSSL